MRPALRRFRVAGLSMVPTLAPGDRVVVIGCPGMRLRAGDVVAARDPRQPSRVVLKRVRRVGRRGIELAGDNPAASTDSRDFGPVAPSLVIGRVVAYAAGG